MHFAINDVANNQLVQVRFARVLVTREHCAMTIAPDLVLLQSRRGQDFKIKRVIEVVTVIRDLICQIGNLPLQRWTIVFFSLPEWGICKVAHASADLHALRM